MAYCQGCGEYIGDYSSYRRNVPGRGEMVLCYRCKHWSDRNPGHSNFPPRHPITPEMNRVRASANSYISIAVGIFMIGIILIMITSRLILGILLIGGSFSLFLFGWGMKRFLRKLGDKQGSTSDGGKQR